MSFFTSTFRPYFLLHPRLQWHTPSLSLKTIIHTEVVVSRACLSVGTLHSVPYLLCYYDRATRYAIVQSTRLLPRATAFFPHSEFIAVFFYYKSRLPPQVSAFGTASFSFLYVLLISCYHAIILSYCTSLSLPACRGCMPNSALDCGIAHARRCTPQTHPSLLASEL